jgi:hypothetical protein
MSKTYALTCGGFVFGWSTISDLRPSRHRAKASGKVPFIIDDHLFRGNLKQHRIGSLRSM